MVYDLQQAGQYKLVAHFQGLGEGEKASLAAELTCIDIFRLERHFNMAEIRW